MYNNKKYEKLKGKYGSCSSWAIWNKDDVKDTSIIDKQFDILNPKYVFLGLNISKDLKNSAWSNFHGGKHDRKLMRACNETKLRGSYLTDIFKDIPESKSFKLKKYIDKNISVIKENVDYFNKEMKDIGVDENTVFIVLGVNASKYFKKYFQHKYKNKVLNYYHYSYWGITDKKWVKELLRKFDIKN